MSVESQRRASKKYLHTKVEDVRIRVPIGQKTVIKDHAAEMGESLNAFCLRAIFSQMERDRDMDSQEQQE